jgi:mRNA-degrading endonuclease RelE of RelBE toxin-antitoxin system
MYKPEFDEQWKGHFERLAPAVKERVVRKIKQVLEGLPGRHLRHGPDFFVEEVGQFRICYTSDEKRKVRRFFFVGDHKEYEKWLGF